MSGREPEKTNYQDKDTKYCEKKRNRPADKKAKLK